MGTYLVRTYLRYVLRVIKTHRFGVIGQTDHGPVTGLRKWSRGKLGKWESGKIRKILVTVREEGAGLAVLLGMGYSRAAATLALERAGGGPAAARSAPTRSDERTGAW